jgi:hypothetical protein
VQKARTLKNEADLDLVWERFNQDRKSLEKVRGIEVLPVQRKDYSALSANSKAFAHCGFEQGDTARSGERGNDYEVFGVCDVFLDTVKILAARGGGEEFDIHIAALT